MVSRSPRKGLPWLRLYTDTVDDERLRLLAYEDRWHYIAILCLKGSGLLDAGDPEHMLQRKVAVKLGLQLRELEGAAARLAEVGLIDEETFQPLDWDTRQYVSDSDPTATERKRRQREKNRLKSRGGDRVTGTSRVTVTDVTRTDTDADTDTDTETTTADDEGLNWDALPQLSDKERTAVVGVLEGIQTSLRQDLLDELAGRWASTNPQPLKRPMAWLAEVAAKARRGEYVPDLALGVRAARQQRESKAEAELRRRQDLAETKARRSDPGNRARFLENLRRANEELAAPRTDRPLHT